MRPVTQLAAAIERAVNGEVRQLRIQLSPSELGTIEIALEIDADRRLGIAILVERPETLDMLRQESRQLERLLAQQGIDLGEAGLELGLMSQERRDDGQRSSPETRELVLADAMTALEPTALSIASPPDPLSPHRLNLSI
jgi:flagellar hook-length control protein FliK